MNLVPVRRDRFQPQVTEPQAPTLDFGDLHQRMDRLFRSIFGELAPEPLAEVPRWQPAVDISENEDAYVVEIEVPGVRRRDLTVDVSEQELRVRGELRASDPNRRVWRRTRRVGEFDQRIRLPGDVDRDAVSASLSRGLLRVTVPKLAAAQPRRVEIAATDED
ncbi:Hsp20/alpha crystallin family protein [Lipingzhangella sp. LS1_29]|uniref:Hsp20/alpha crystallin family protein n=1 Tax=Lipingzhangella rawalii TaxID=2055835 RepID=A0ABU2H4U0_9ACTN|nr:Hsp20/alpha crystallin family protein [Lipingzhangella rawalii]MDS1270329.1 Hsp20/alpha crystallin family protein [Lipingzhangella rawalii]